MKIMVVGLNHQVQPSIIRNLGHEAIRLEQEQKENFAATLGRIVRERGVRFIGEEAKHGVQMIAALVAGQLGSSYANIEMTPTEREGRGIPADYTDENSTYSWEQKQEWHRQREEYMAQKALTEAKDADSGLILCGREHTAALAEGFREAGHEVETYDLYQEPWYIEDWMSYLLTH